jgi:hypothetical protein
LRQYALAKQLGLRFNADYFEISEKFIELAAAFTADLNVTLPLSRIRYEPISLNPEDWEVS